MQYKNNAIQDFWHGENIHGVIGKYSRDPTHFTLSQTSPGFYVSAVEFF